MKHQSLPFKSPAFLFSLLTVSLFAILVFSWVYGFALMDPMRVGWVSGEDPGVAFYGFNFFIADQWRVPPGAMSNFNGPIGTTLVFSDGYPLFALILKAIHTWVSPFTLPFQIVGLWMAFCFLAQGIASFMILYRESRDLAFSWMGSVFFILSPALVFRSIESTRHYSLMGHFLVLVALGEWFAWARRREYRQWVWNTLLGVSLGIHFYLFCMVAFVYLIPTIEAALERRLAIKQWIHRQLTTGLMIGGLGVLYGYGGVPAGDAQGGGFGLFAMDLFAWLISEGHALSQPFKSLNYLIQREGFQYLGLGILLGWGWIGYTYRSEIRKLADVFKRFPVPASVFSFLLLIALSRRLWICGSRLSIFVTLPLWFGIFYWLVRKVRPMGKGLAMLWALILIVFYNGVGPLVRSSGRMGWVLTYALIFGFLMIIHERVRFSKRMIAVLLGVQIADLYPLHSYVREIHFGSRSAETSAPLSEEVRAFFGENARKILLLTSNEYFQSPTLNAFALQKRIPIGPTYLSRHDHGARARLLEEWRKKVEEHRLSEGEFVFIGEEPAHRALIESILLKTSGYRTLPWTGGVLVGI